MILLCAAAYFIEGLHGRFTVPFFALVAIALYLIPSKKKVRCHNRQIHKNTILKGGIRKRNQAPYDVMGFRLFDKVKWKGQNCFIFGRRARGYFNIRKLDGTLISGDVNYKKLKFLETRRTYLIERRCGNSSPA